MIVAISAALPEIRSLVDMRFGRAPGFMIYNTETGSASFVPNTQNLNAAQGAGIQSAGVVIETGALAVITGHCGPKAFNVLKGANIDIYTVSGGTITEAIDAFMAKKLTAIESANVEGHWI